MPIAMSIFAAHHGAAVLLLLLPLLPKLTATTHHCHHHHKPLKYLLFSLFQYENINKIDYIIVPGVAGPPVSQTTTPFGTIFAFHDPLTLGVNASSPTVGFAQGTSVTVGVDRLQSISVAKISIRLKRCKGSVSIVGITDNVKASEHPVVGGMGDLLFVQGYVTSSPVDLVGSEVVYKIEFHLYWPPYATRVM